METDKHGLRVGYLGGEEESSYTEFGLKRDQQDEKMRITKKRHAIVSPRVRNIMLLKARAIANATKEDISKEVLNHDDNEDGHKPHDSITKTTLHNILSQTAENENKLNNKKMQKRALHDQSYADVASGSAITSETDAEINGRSKDQTADSSSELDGVRRESEAETKGEPEFTGKNIGSFKEKGSGDVQLSGSGMMLSQNLREQVTTPGADGRKVVSGHRGPQRESSFIKHVRLRDHANPPKGIVNGEGKSGSEKMPFDPILLFQVRNIRTNVLKAEKQATVELNDVRKEFRAKMEDVEEDLRMVKKLTSNVHKKVGITVQQALAMARQAKTNATNRLFMARSKLRLFVTSRVYYVTNYSSPQAPPSLSAGEGFWVREWSPTYSFISTRTRPLTRPLTRLSSSRSFCFFLYLPFKWLFKSTMFKSRKSPSLLSDDSFNTKGSSFIV